MKVASCWWTDDDGGFSENFRGVADKKKSKNNYTRTQNGKKKIFSETAKSEGERLLS